MDLIALPELPVSYQCIVSAYGFYQQFINVHCYQSRLTNLNIELDRREAVSKNKVEQDFGTFWPKISTHPF